MVAHLGCVAIPLSHKFWEQAKGCTTYGETDHTRSKFSCLTQKFLLSYCGHRALGKLDAGLRRLGRRVSDDGKSSVQANPPRSRIGAIGFLPCLARLDSKPNLRYT